MPLEEEGPRATDRGKHCQNLRPSGTVKICDIVKICDQVTKWLLFGTDLLIIFHVILNDKLINGKFTSSLNVCAEF